MEPNNNTTLHKQATLTMPSDVAPPNHKGALRAADVEIPSAKRGGQRLETLSGVRRRIRGKTTVAPEVLKSMTKKNKRKKTKSNDTPEKQQKPAPRKKWAKCFVPRLKVKRDTIVQPTFVEQRASLDGKRPGESYLLMANKGDRDRYVVGMTDRKSPDHFHFMTVLKGLVDQGEITTKTEARA